jgi:membrane-bound lytic murein transglycosylase A
MALKGAVSLALPFCAALAMLFAVACAPPRPPAPAAGPLRLTQLQFPQVQGWTTTDPRPALAAFQRSCARLLQRDPAAAMGGAGYAGTAADWRPACERAAQAATNDAAAARAFFESEFAAYRIGRGALPEGLFTGYYEPLLTGSRTRHGPYQTPLYGVPSDLITVDLGQFREALRGQNITGRVQGNRLVPYAPRAEIVQNGLPQAQALVYVDDPVDAFFLQIQGSGRVMLDDGTVLRAAYAGQNGHPYTAIGAVLIQMGALTRENVSMQSIRGWLAANPREMDTLMNRNASYVFFTAQPLGDPALGANGAAGVPLTPVGSLAVDNSIHPYGVPLFVQGTAPTAAGTQPEPRFDKLLIAQDTGGAIRGPIRGDVYWGFGDEAGAIAGRMRTTGTLVVLLPHAVAMRLGPRREFPGVGA